MPPTKRTALLLALERNRGELDPEVLRRLLAALAPKGSPAPKRGQTP